MNVAIYFDARRGRTRRHPGKWVVTVKHGRTGSLATSRTFANETDARAYAARL